MIITLLKCKMKFFIGALFFRRLNTMYSSTLTLQVFNDCFSWCISISRTSYSVYYHLQTSQTVIVLRQTFEEKLIGNFVKNEP